ncbi:MAG: anhydro-N-acetylmuramic acid kinase [Abditibacteriota bacterium]|nr:anhydro-N-acetylmuramic acid kinase [Abditibacteriota bacterium]
MNNWLSNYSQKSTWRAIGLMSGTSLDGIDAACIEISGDFPDVKISVLGFVTHTFAPGLRERIMSVCENGHVEDLARLDVELGSVFADAAIEVANACGLELEAIDVIGSHGQTVCHLSSVRATLQIGQSALIAERTGRPVVSDFRTADMAAGGEGAPLVPFVDWLLLRDAGVHRITQNIGGIANLTWLPAGGTLDDVRAWDTGPGNMVIDQCVRIASQGQQDYDENGIRASQGHVDEAWLYEKMQHPFFALPAPKSAGREEFGRAFALQFYEEGKRRGLAPNDIIATATALTARSIAGAYQVLWKTEKVDPAGCEILIGGGGAFNPTLWHMLEVQTAPARLRRLEELEMGSDAKEAIAFALLAHAALLGVPNTVPGATGADRAVVAGKITPPKVL